MTAGDAGAEPFIGNNLIAMAWADRRITSGQLARNWLPVYAGNVAGAFATVLVVCLSGTLGMADGSVAETATAIARAKIELSASEAFFRGVPCNVLVCLAVWLCFAAHTVIGKIFAIIFPSSAFVALGFEHSVANMSLIPIGLIAEGGAWSAANLAGFAHNLVFVAAGNIVGGAVLVALVYWLVYLWRPPDNTRRR